MLFFIFFLSLENLGPGFSLFLIWRRFALICQKPLNWTSLCLQVHENTLISLFYFRALSFQFILTLLHTYEATNKLNGTFCAGGKTGLPKVNKSTVFQKNRELHLMQAPKVMLSFTLLLISICNKQHMIPVLAFIPVYSFGCL